MLSNKSSLRMVKKKKSFLEMLEGVPFWVWPFVALGLIVLIVIPAIGLARVTTSNSSFCVTCHGTGETPDRSKLSLVHPDFNKVSCVDCHAKGGHIVYEGYVKGFMAEAERVSPNCTKCHQPITKTNEQKDFKFNFLDINITHKAHLERGATCTTCHANVAHDMKEVPTNRPTMNNCYSCHAKSDSCTKCHNQKIPAKPLPPPAPAGIDMPGDGRVYYLRICSACHGAQGSQVSKIDLRSKEYLDKKGVKELAKAIEAGKGNMHGFGLSKGGHLNEEQISSIVAYIQEESVSKAEPNAEVLYNRHCLVCHGKEGDKIAGVPIFSGDFWSFRDRDGIFRSIQIGKGGMPASGKAEGGNLTRQEIEVLMNYLNKEAALPATSGAAAAGPPLQQVNSVQGKALYEKNCLTCHGADGNQFPMAKLGSADYIKQKGISELVKSTAEGKGGMPAYSREKGGALSSAEIEAIIGYLSEGAK